jgi:hypothetical protein
MITIAAIAAGIVWVAASVEGIRTMTELGKSRSTATRILSAKGANG